MYRLNLLHRKCLITTDEVIALAPTDQSVDPRNLLSAIQIAEERFIKPSICKQLYYDFREKKNIVVTDINLDYLQGLVNESLAEAEVVELNEGDLINAIELVDDSWYVELWNEHLWKLIAECVVYTASPTNYSRFTSSGEMQNNPKTITFQGDGQGSSSVDLKTIQWKMDKIMQDRIDPLIAAMHEWICDNKAHFPLYTCKQCDCKKDDGVSISRKSGWIHGLYDKRKNDKWREE